MEKLKQLEAILDPILKGSHRQNPAIIKSAH